MSQKLIIGGDSLFAEIAHEYFTYDSRYEVVAFTVEQAFRTRDTFRGLPVVAFETVQDVYDPADHDFYAALTYAQVNRLRQRIAAEAKAKGYALASYVSSRAFVWRNVELGEHCFIFEDNTVQPFVTVGSNVVMWSGNHIGHHTTVRDNVFIASHAVISGSRSPKGSLERAARWMTASKPSRSASSASRTSLRAHGTSARGPPGA